MRRQPKRIVMFGTGDIGSVAFCYFSDDSPYEVAAFTVDDDHLRGEEHLGVPVVGFSRVEKAFPPDEYGMFVAIGYRGMNRVRESKYWQAKSKGYTLVSYVSPRSSIAKNVLIGDNCLVLDGLVVQPFVRIGNNVTIWSGSHIGHHSSIGDHCFIAPRVAIAGHVTVESNCFLGINATIRNAITIARGSLIGAGALILRDTEIDAVYKGSETPKHAVASGQLRKI